MANTKLPPTPTGVPPGHSFWNDWYERLRNIVNSTLVNHNDLQSIQGGSPTERYHLTATQQTDLTDSGDSALHFHSSDRARANHTGTQDHNTTLSGLQGGSASEQFHLTSAEYTGTGTGNFVRQTSPSLTTPNIGTPSAGTLTSCTGLPISTGVSGLGAGVATFLGTPSSANLASAVTDETGSGALVFATSPTLTTPTINTAASVGGSWTAASTWTLPAHTLGGTVSGGGNQINNVIIGASSPLAGSFTTLSSSGTATLATVNTAQGTTGSLITNASETIFTPGAGTYLVIVDSSDTDNTSWRGSWFIWASGTIVITAITTASNTDVINSGGNIQVKNTSGTTVALRWAYTRIR